MLRYSPNLARRVLRGAPILQPQTLLLVQSLHSRSSIPRGRASIEASSYRQRRNIRRPQSSSSSSSPFRPGRKGDPPSSAETAEEKERRRLEALRAAKERWPSWVPMPHSLAEALEESRRSQAKPSSKGAEEEVEQIFIPRDSRQHSSRQGEGSSNTSRNDDGLFDRIFGQRSRQATGARGSSNGSFGSGSRGTWSAPPITRSPQSQHRHWIHSRGGRVFIVVGLGGAGLYYLGHLEQVPYTGRSRFRDVTEEEEAELGREAFQEVMAQYRGRILPPNHQYSIMARRVATRIIRAAEDLHGLDFTDVEQGHANTDPNDTTYARDSVRNTKWQVFVINDPKQVNAFVLPGGQIFVFTGILPLCRGEDGLAAVLGHEVSHKLCSHMAEKTSGVKVVRFLGLLLAMTGIDFSLSHVLLQYLMSLPNSRKLEVEADDLGLKLMSRACFDPEEAPRLWARMARAEKTGLPTIMSTHPQSSSREKSLTKALPEAIEIRRRAGCPEKRSMDSFKSATSIGRMRA